MNAPVIDCWSTTPAVEAALDYSRAFGESLGQNPVIVVEGGYFDPRDRVATDRSEHLRASFALLDGLRQLGLGNQITYRLAALHNDFVPDIECDPCDMTDVQDNRPSNGTPEVPQWAKDVYAHCGHPEDVRGLEIFSMRRTRNRAARWLEKVLVRGDGCVRSESTPGSAARYVFVDTDIGPKLVAYQRPTGGLTMRCAGLMAQHYFDLYQSARAVRGPVSDLWVFDFNRPAEEPRVRGGANVSFALYPWPEHIQGRIINCIEYPPKASGTRLAVTVRE